MSRLETLMDAVHVLLNDATVEKVLGRRKDGRNGKRRRVHWYSEGGIIQKHLRSGGTVEGTDKQVSVYERFERVSVLVSAETVDTLDILLDNMIAAISNVAPNGSAIFDGYTWDYGEVAQRMPQSELQFDIKWPVSDEIKGLTTITAEENTCDFEEDE